MNDFLAYLGSWSVFKWILLVLAAGFIGHFGRMAADIIIQRIRLRRRQKEGAPTSWKEPFEPQPSSPSPAAFPDKKILKAVAKAKKKEAKKR